MGETRHRPAVTPPTRSDRARQTPPRPTGPVLKAALLVAFVLMALVVVFLAGRAFQAAQDLAGPQVVVIEKIGDVRGAYVLNHTHVAEEAPEFDRLLFLAFRSGKASSNDPAVVEEVRTYLDARAQEQGYERFSEPPFENVFVWDDDTFRVIYFDRG